MRTIRLRLISRRHVYTLTCALLVFAASALGQLNRGQISGFVTDPTGAFVIGAGVTVTDEATGFSTHVTSNDRGYWGAPNLPPAYYTVSIEAVGFKKYTQTKVRLNALDSVAVNASLEVGTITESINVVASVAQLQSESGVVGRVVESRQIQDMTLNGRNPIQTLPMLKAGISNGNIDTFNPDSLGTGTWCVFSACTAGNGSPAVTIDGALAAPRTRGAAMLGVPNADAVEEMQILVANYNAEYGRSSSAQVRFVTKSGGKEFHGALWEYFRNNALDANTWSRNASANPLYTGGAAPFRYNQPGFNIGGPMYIPNKFNTGRNKLFFFWAEEWIRWIQYSTNTGTVPTQAMRSGDFGQLLTASPFMSARVIVDPLSGNQPFTNNVIPKNRQSPTGIALLNVYPLPTPGFQQGASNWIGTSPNPRNTRKDTIRLDYNLSSKQRVSFRGDHFGWASVDAFNGTFAIAPTEWNRPNYTSVLNLTSTLTPTLINEAFFSASVDRVYMKIHASAPYARSLYGINYPYLFPDSKNLMDVIPTINIQNFSTVNRGGYPGFSSGPIWVWSDNLTKIVGNHTFKFGGFIEHSGQNNQDQSNNPNGNFTFNDVGTNASLSGVGIANVAIGLFTNYAEGGNLAYTPSRATSIDVFAQDGWKVTPKLKVEYGVRWMYWPFWPARWQSQALFVPDYFDRSNMAVVDPKTGYITSGDPYNGIVLPGSGWGPSAIGRVPAATDASQGNFVRLFHNLPDGFWPTPTDVFDPRMGIAYALNNKTVIRTGWGMFHERSMVSAYANPPIQPSATVINGVADNPLGATGVKIPFTLSAQDPHWKYPTAMNWNFTIQREIPGKTTVEVAYVGRQAYHSGGPDGHTVNINQLQPGTLQANPGVNANALRPFQGAAQIMMRGLSEDSHYNSLQIQVERRFTSGLGFNVAYTWSKAIDDAESPFEDAYNAMRSRGLANADIPQTLVFNYIYEIPLLKNNKGLVGKVAGGWELSGINQFQAGTPFSIALGTDYAGVGPGSGNQHWNVNGDPHISDPKFSTSLNDQNFYFNPKVFSQPLAGTFGNSGRNILRNPGIMNWDLGMRKNFRVTERARFQFRTEVYNVLNHPNWSAATSNPTSSFFGRVNTKSGSRLLQLALRFEF